MISGYVKLKLYTMFRFRKNKPVRVVPRVIMDEVPKETVSEDGVTLVSYVEVPNTEIASTLPSYSDYQLSKLLEANVPLRQIDAAVLDAVPSDETIESVVSDLENRDKDDVEPSNE